MKVRCIDASHYNERLTVGKVYEVTEDPQESDMWCFTDDSGCHEAGAFKCRFEPVTDEAEAPPEQPKVDPYEAHRVKWDELGSAAMQMRGQDAISGATARLLRGLESEKVRERVREFPRQGRNFELKGKR